MTEFQYPELDEQLFREVLPNGLTVSVIRRRGFARGVAYFVTNYGSIHNCFRLDGKEYATPAGVAHYLEHKMFELPGNRDVTAEFAGLGASVNAFTSYDMTAYYFSCTQEFDRCLRLLLEFVSTPYFTKESVERERGIIDQEIGMNLDAPDSVIFDNLMAALYENHPARMPILGTRESIREITPEILELCHRAFYHPGNMLLCVIADVDPEEVKTAAMEVLGSEKRPMGEKQADWPEEMTPVLPETVCAMEVAMPTFSLAFKCEPTGMGSQAIRREMVADLAAEALFGESSELYLRLYEQGLIDSSFGGGFETMEGCAMLCASGDSEDPLAVRDAIIAQAEKLIREGIGQEEFLRLKRSALGRRIRGLDSLDGTCFRVCAYHFAGFDYFRFPEIYREIQRQDILEFLSRVVRRERCAISIIDPLDTEEENP
ncbi:MAG: pitrilysin family protein [Candidatus Faecousia sp.]|nr:pitrilysin family protein [Candidatus Faecousia sp.]